MVSKVASMWFPCTTINSTAYGDLGRRGVYLIYVFAPGSNIFDAGGYLGCPPGSSSGLCRPLIFSHSILKGEKYIASGPGLSRNIRQDTALMEAASKVKHSKPLIGNFDSNASLDFKVGGFQWSHRRPLTQLSQHGVGAVLSNFCRVGPDSHLLIPSGSFRSSSIGSRLQFWDVLVSYFYCSVVHMCDCSVRTGRRSSGPGCRAPSTMKCTMAIIYFSSLLIYHRLTSHKYFIPELRTFSTRASAMGTEATAKL